MAGYFGSKRSSSLVSTKGITLEEVKLAASGDSITKSDGTTAVLSESGGVVTLNNGTIGSGVVFPVLGDAASGTVSQTGGTAGDPGTGTPTGDIIEEGHTARGSYVKFANGTMICTNFASASVALNNSYGNLFIGTDANNYNHPASFATITGAGHIVTSSSGGRAIVSNVFLNNTQITSVDYLHPNSQGSLGITTKFIIYGTWY